MGKGSGGYAVDCRFVIQNNCQLAFLSSFLAKPSEAKFPGRFAKRSEP